MTEPVAGRGGDGRISVRLLVAALLAQFVLFGGLILVAINGFPGLAPDHPAEQARPARPAHPARPVPAGPAGTSCTRPRPRAERRIARHECARGRRRR